MISDTKIDIIIEYAIVLVVIILVLCLHPIVFQNNIGKIPVRIIMAVSIIALAMLLLSYLWHIREDTKIKEDLRYEELGNLFSDKFINPANRAVTFATVLSQHPIFFLW